MHTNSSLGDSLCNQLFMDFLNTGLWMRLCLSQKNGPVLHELTESFSNPFRQL